MKKLKSLAALLVSALAIAMMTGCSSLGSAGGGAEGGAAGGSSIILIAYVAVFGAIIYFFSYRPQKKEKAKKEEMMSTLAIGDTILTSSGFYGVVIDITDDMVIVEFGNNKNCRIPMQKSAIVAIEKAESAQ